MKNLFKYALVGMLFLLSFIGIKSVYAESYNSGRITGSEYIPGVYLKKVKPNGYTMYQQARVLRKTDDNSYVYCLQPFVLIDTEEQDYEIIRDDYNLVLGLTEEQWNRVSLLAYYGYGYGNHTNIEWISITQMLIWRTVNPESDIYYTDTLKGNRIDKFATEIAELEKLVSDHSKKPILNMPDTLTIGETIRITDSNGVLNKYKITGTSNVDATIDGNDLVIRATGVGEAKVNLALSDTKHELPPIVYYSTHSQNVMTVGSYDPIYTSASTKIVGGKIEINKLDSSCNCSKPSGDATLEGAKYGIYDVDGNLLETLTTDANGYAISNYLPSLGNYTVKEISPSNGYNLDNTVYTATLSENNLIANVKVYENVIKGKLYITKVMASAQTGLMTPEPNVKFGIYNSNNELVIEKTTDSNGEFNVTLPYGKYTLKQLTTTKGFEYAKDYEFVIDLNDKEIKEVISNAEITAKLKVIKIDKDTGEVIKKSGITFKIKSLKTDDYVCQSITYPNNETLCEFKTDDNGILITPYPLLSGDYLLEEVDSPLDGYLWNDEKASFSIDETSKFIDDESVGTILEIKFANKEVKGNINIKKLGETVEIKDNKLFYDFENLENVTIGLYASEDIYSANGVLKYQKDDLIGKYKTDKEGNILIEDLYLGKYYIKEISTDDNHVLDETKYEIELKYLDEYTEIVTENLEIKNDLKTGKLLFTKSDLTTSKAIADTKISIYTEDDELIYEGITDNEGKIEIDRLPLGKYYIVETKASTGYKLSDEKVYFEIKENGEVVKANMTNEKIKGTLEFTKIDFSTEEALPNTLIEIYDENDNLIYTDITNDEGKIVINEIEYGKYYILEKNAPDGYELNTEKMYFEILEDGQIVKCTMTDEKVVIDVPNTESNNYTIPLLVILITIANGIVIYEEVKKRKNK